MLKRRRILLAYSCFVRIAPSPEATVKRVPVRPVRESFAGWSRSIV